MPKKTKKQKLLAELHRKIETVTKPTSSDFVKSQNIPATITPSASSASNLTYNKHVVTKPKTQNLVANYSHVKHDLIRITIFTVATTIFQSVLYFFLHRR